MGDGRMGWVKTRISSHAVQIGCWAQVPMPKKVPPPTIPRLKAREPQQPRLLIFFVETATIWGMNGDGISFMPFWTIPSIGCFQAERWVEEFLEGSRMIWMERICSSRICHLQLVAFARCMTSRPDAGPCMCSSIHSTKQRFWMISGCTEAAAAWLYLEPFSKFPACTANMPKCMAWTSWLHVSRNWALLWHFFMRSTSKSWDTVGIDWIVGGWSFLQQFWVKVYQIHIRPKTIPPVVQVQDPARILGAWLTMITEQKRSENTSNSAFLYWTWNCWCQLAIPWKVLFYFKSIATQIPSTSFNILQPSTTMGKFTKALFSSYGKGQRSELTLLKCWEFGARMGTSVFLGGPGALDSWSWILQDHQSRQHGLDLGFCFDSVLLHCSSSMIFSRKSPMKSY